MASIEFLNNRIEGAKKKIDSLNKKWIRIHDAKETCWTINPYYYDEYDLTRTEKELKEAKESLAKYENELELEKEKEVSRNVPAILEFLEQWKKRVRSIYGDVIRDYFDLSNKVKCAYEKSHTKPWCVDKESEEYKEYTKLHDELNENLYGVYEEKVVERYGKRPIRVKVRDGKWEFAKTYFCLNIGMSMEKLEKDLVEEAKRKYDFIVNRVCAICGKIVDASGLSVGEKGDLNGIIIGEKTNASVKTIGAGGYAVQIFHYRTLIHEVKK